MKNIVAMNNNIFNIYIYIYPPLPNPMPLPQAPRTAPGPTARAVAHCGSGDSPTVLLCRVWLQPKWIMEW